MSIIEGFDGIQRDYNEAIDVDGYWYCEYRRIIPRIGVLPVLDNEENQPACIYKDKNGNVVLEEYRVEGQLHRTDGPAVKGIDKKQETIYAWWGVIVPESWTKKAPTADEILHLENAEQRQVAIRHMGLEKFVNSIETD